MSTGNPLEVYKTGNRDAGPFVGLTGPLPLGPLLVSFTWMFQTLGSNILLRIQVTPRVARLVAIASKLYLFLRLELKTLLVRKRSASRHSLRNLKGPH